MIFGHKLLHLFGVIIYTLSPSLTKEFETEQLDAKSLGEFLRETEISGLEVNYPKPKQVLAVMLGQSSQLNSDLFTPSPETKVRWESIINDQFSGGGWHPGPDGYSKIICNVIRTFSLSN